MIAGSRFVIAGLSRLSTRVARTLDERGADVVVVGDSDDDEARDAASLLPDSVRVVTRGGDRVDRLREAGVEDADCLLALASDDYENLRMAAAGSEVAPDVPVVLRTFDPELADRLETGLNVRRAFSVSALAAPAFVAAALGETVVEVLRLGRREIPLCLLDAFDGAPICGHTAHEIKQGTRCAVVARAGTDGEWQSAEAFDAPVEPGDQILVGGLLIDVLRLALENTPTEVTEAPRHRARRNRSGEQVRAMTSSFLPVAAGVFLAVFVLTAIVYGRSLHLGPVDAVEAAVNATLGEPAPEEASTFLTLFSILATLLGVCLIGVLFSFVAAVVLAERLEERMGRRVRRMRDHVVVLGLGRVGYRVVQLLHELKVPVAALERESGSRFLAAVGSYAPVLTGDIRLRENLERVGVDRARCVIACTDDDVANLAAALEAKRIEPSARTVARIFDDNLARRVGSAFGIDEAVSATGVASSSFVGAATDGRARRRIVQGDLELDALRLDLRRGLAAAEVDQWRAEGLRVLAVQRDADTVDPPTVAVGRGIAPGESAIVVGPTAVVDELLAGRAASSPTDSPLRSSEPDQPHPGQGAASAP